MADIFNNIIQGAEFREELFVAQSQARLSEMLDDKGVSRAELARKLGVSRARVTQIFSDEATNLTLRLLARSFLALEEEPVILTRSEYERLKDGTNSQPSGARGSDKRRRSTDGLSTSLIADLLRANDIELDQERPGRRPDNAKQWAEAGSNVVPLRRSTNG
jgi:transcriptional regulator with XRE-family HTH domain